MAAWRYEISLLVLKIFHLLAALTREIFFNTRREISYLRTAMYYPVCATYSAIKTLGIKMFRIIH